MRTRTSQLEDYLFGGPYPRGYPTGLERVLKRKLQMLNAATTLNDLRVPPSNHLEKLRGNLESRYSIRINAQYRLVFYWNQTKREAEDVYLDDYHK